MLGVHMDAIHVKLNLLQSAWGSCFWILTCGFLVTWYLSGFQGIQRLPSAVYESKSSNICHYIFICALASLYLTWISMGFGTLLFRRNVHIKKRRDLRNAIGFQKSLSGSTRSSKCTKTPNCESWRHTFGSFGIWLLIMNYKNCRFKF